MAEKAGRFIVIIGPDGAGKTTLASALLDSWHGESAYIHWIPPLWTRLEPRPGVDRPIPKVLRRESSLASSVIRLVANVLRSWAFYLIRIRPALARGTLVVGDRWGYGYVGQPTALRFVAPSWIAKAGVRSMPTPDLTVLLTSTVDVILGRKAELSRAELRAEMDRWEAFQFPNSMTLEADNEVSTLVDAVLGQLERFGR